VQPSIKTVALFMVELNAIIIYIVFD